MSASRVPDAWWVLGLFLTGTSSPARSGKVTLDIVTMQDRTGYGVDLSQASGYAVTITNPSGILGGMGKLGTSEHREVYPIRSRPEPPIHTW